MMLKLCLMVFYGVELVWALVAQADGIDPAFRSIACAWGTDVRCVYSPKDAFAVQMNVPLGTKYCSVCPHG